MNATATLRTFCDAVEQRNGSAFAELFTQDGIYHDVFYGAFAGRARIAEMIDDWFYRTATDFRWDMHTPVSDGTTLYARYTFSYRSTLPEAKGASAMFEGVAIMTLRDGKIAEYHEARQYRDRFCGHEFRAGAHRKDCRKTRRGVESAAGDEAASGAVTLLPSLRRLGVRSSSAHRGGAGCAIGLRCASAATVDVPIGPCWSYKKHSPIATPSVAW